MRGKKQKRRIDFAISRRRVQVAKLYSERKTQKEIGALLGVDQKTICRDVAAIMEEWRAKRVEETDARVARIHAELDRLRERAWAQLEKSTLPARVKRLETEKGPPIGDTQQASILGSKSTITEEEQAGDPRWANVIIAADQEEAKLLGAYKPQKVANTDPSGNAAAPANLMIFRVGGDGDNSNSR
jgi:hypothetical protein